MNPVILALDEATLASVQAIGGCAFPPSIISLMGIDFFAGRQVLVILEGKATAARWLTHRLEAVGCKPCVFPFFSNHNLKSYVLEVAKANQRGGEVWI